MGSIELQPAHGSLLLLLGRVLNPGLIKERLHRRVLVGELPDGQLVGLVVGKTKVVLRAQKGLLCLVECVDGLVYLLDRLAESSAGKLVVLSELLLELKEFLLEVGDIQGLVLGDGKLLLVLE